MARSRRSPCPVVFALDLVGDRWTLLLLRDAIMFGRRYYQEFLESGEGIATNVLADRLNRLETAGLLAKERDPEDGKRFLYSVTQKGIDTLPVLLEMILWSSKHDPESVVPPEFAARIERDRTNLMAEILAGNAPQRPTPESGGTDC